MEQQNNTKIKKEEKMTDSNVGKTKVSRANVKENRISMPNKEPQAEYVRVRSGADRIFLVCVILLVCFGSIMVFSASYHYSGIKYGDGLYLAKRQLMFAIVGILAMLVVTRFNYKLFKLLSVPAYIFSMFLLVLVIVMGTSGGGAQRWLVIPGTPISFQPSEIAKLAIVLMLSWYMSKYHDKITDYTDKKNYLLCGLGGPLAILLTLAVAVVLEKHFSGLIIIVLIGAIIMFAGGSKWNYLVGFGILAFALVSVAVLTLGYSSERIVAWIDPTQDAQGSGWQTLQGLKAIGSGGVFGLGLGNSRLKNGYVSMPHNDFIFAIVCEELGYIGALAAITLFGILIWRGFVIASKAPDIFSSLTVIGITSKVAIQTIFNIAVVTKVIPNTGISLPFFSYGGTALFILMIEMGIVLSISKHSYQKKA